MKALCVAICAFVGLCQACQPPPPGPDIDLSKFIGKRWHSVVTNRSPLDQAFSCIEHGGEKLIPGGIINTFSTMNSDGEVEQGKARLLKTGDGYYTEEYGKDLGSPEDFADTFAKTKMAVRRGQEVDSPKLAIYTDYENYIFSIACDPNGRRDIWYHARTRSPTAEDILRVTNKLGEIGDGWSELQLFLDKCVEN